jgi:hypothetical protein
MGNRRKEALPQRYEIALHWTILGARSPVRVDDIGEPSCFACGFYDSGWDRNDRVERRWNDSNLERAHVIAASQGGSCSVDNFVLLCANCHADAPMTLFAPTMFAWIRSRECFRKTLVDRFVKELENACRVFNVSVDKVTLWGEQRGIERCASEVVASSGRHFGCGVSVSSLAYELARMAGEWGR